MIVNGLAIFSNLLTITHGFAENRGNEIVPLLDNRLDRGLTLDSHDGNALRQSDLLAVGGQPTMGQFLS